MQQYNNVDIINKHLGIKKEGENNGMTQPVQEYKTSLVKVCNTYLSMINSQFAANKVEFSEYGKVCVMNAISVLDGLLKTNSLDWNSPNLDTSSLTRMLQKVAIWELNPEASNHEIYFTLRNTNFGDSKNPVWKKVIEVGVEGDGNQKLVERFGTNVKKIYPAWLVRENDKFTYPRHVGIKIEDPTWEPTGKGNVVRVVYPIQYNDGHIEYHIAERDDVAKNLYAHVANNMMNETFGICPDRFKATSEQKEAIRKRKEELLKIIDEKGLNAIDEPVLQNWISPSWSSTSGKESMIIRKMKNNIFKPIPKDFGNSYLNSVMESSRDYMDAEYKEQTVEEVNNVQKKQIEESEVTSINNEEKPKTEETKEEKQENLFDRF